MTVIGKRPPLDPELAAALSVVQPDGYVAITPELIGMFREATVDLMPTDDVLGLDGTVSVETRSATLADGASMELLILRPNSVAGVTAPAIYYLHGGGMILGTNRTGIEIPLAWAVEFGAVVVSAEYRLAPDFPDPVPIEDSYAGLVWTFEHADELGIDPERIVIAGTSAGGGLAAGVALMARDRSGPKLLGQVLMCPMLDDRNETPSSYEGVGEGVWDRTANYTGWDALLGSRRGGADVTVYAAPSRSVDLSGLPTAFVDVGSAELFRDEDVDYAVRMWRAGTQVELHVWPGGFHAFDNIAPQATLSLASVKTRTAWVGRLLGSS